MATNNISKGELFRRYQLQKSLEYEEEDQNEEQLEFNDQLESGKDGHGEQAFACEEEEAAKTSTCSNEASTKKRKKMQKQAVSKKVKKFAWTDDKVEDLLKYINDYKTNCDFKGIDFEADLATLYAAVRKCNSSASVIKTPRSIRKFFFHSDSGKIPLNRLSHHCSVRPGFRQILPRRQACLGAFRSRATAISYWLAI